MCKESLDLTDCSPKKRFPLFQKSFSPFPCVSTPSFWLLKLGWKWQIHSQRLCFSAVPLLQIPVKGSEKRRYSYLFPFSLLIFMANCLSSSSCSNANEQTMPELCVVTSSKILTLVIILTFIATAHCLIIVVTTQSGITRWNIEQYSMA